VRGQNLGADSGASRAAVLRDAFDRGFAEPPAIAQRETVDLLSIRLGGDAFALRLVETAGLFSDRKITPVPTPLRELRGLAGVRGTLVPVYDLGVLLGYAIANAPRWIVMAREAPVAFAIETFVGQLRIDRAALITNEAAGREHVREIARDEDVSRPIVHLPSLVAAIGKRASTSISREA
jgi:chemotaxis signal transduction protein